MSFLKTKAFQIVPVAISLTYVAYVAKDRFAFHDDLREEKLVSERRDSFTQ
jgi:hypothetical protein